MKNENNTLTIIALVLQAIDVAVGIWAVSNSHTAIIVVCILAFLSLSILLIIKIRPLVKRMISSNKGRNNDLPKDDNTKDDSVFISEYPSDGITIPVGKMFKKSWTVKNAGNTIWKNRTLRCVEYVNDCFFPVETVIKIPKTYPGEIITLKVEYKALVEGDYHSKWKMFDQDNNLIYPEKSVGLGVNILVRKSVH